MEFYERLNSRLGDDRFLQINLGRESAGNRVYLSQIALGIVTVTIKGEKDSATYKVMQAGAVLKPLKNEDESVEWTAIETEDISEVAKSLSKLINLPEPEPSVAAS